MGVRNLWLILAPICEKKSIWELQNQTVAIDLSVWICENQTIDYTNRNLYLRNLFFRTSYMLLLGLKPIFVLEGTAPELKHNEINRRKNLKSNETKSNISRSRLISFQKQCEELLTYMGVTCVNSNGEAEALCAFLNNEGIVDGVITKDSDCFLYGARRVYRNFNISSNGGTYEKYDMDSIETKLNLGRNKLIAFSLLCGCDYNEKGIEGVGKETALKFLSTESDHDVLEQLTKWRNSSMNTATLSKTALAVRQKALLNPEFPFYNIQNEFLNHNYNNFQLKYSWKRPNLKQFVIFVERKLAWNTNYAIEKFLPLLSRWHLLHDHINAELSLECISKKRNLRGVQSYEVKWQGFDHNTIEPMSYLKLKYHKEIEDFESTKKNKRGIVKNTRKRKKETVFDNLVDEMLNLSIDSYIQTAPEDFSSTAAEESITVSDFECSAADLLELSFIVESIVSKRSKE